MSMSYQDERTFTIPKGSGLSGPHIVSHAFRRIPRTAGMEHGPASLPTQASDRNGSTAVHPVSCGNRQQWVDCRPSLSEDPSRLFICFSSKDQTIALEVVEFLEAEGLKCWISSRNIPLGDNYQESIVTALEGAHGIVFLFSESSIASGEIKKELSLASSGGKPILPLRLSPVIPTGALRYELATHQWIDIFPDRE